MDIGVKGFALGGNLLHPQLFQHSLELGHGHLHALGIGLVGGLLLQRPLQIVIHREQFLDGVRPGGGPGVFLFLLASLAVVVVLRQQPEVFVFLLPQGLLEGFLLAGFLLFLRGFGHFLRGLLLGFLGDLILIVIFLAHGMWYPPHSSGSLPAGGGISPLPNMRERPSAK